MGSEMTLGSPVYACPDAADSLLRRELTIVAPFEVA